MFSITKDSEAINITREIEAKLMKSSYSVTGFTI